MHFEEHRKTWQRWKVLSVSRLQCYCHSLIICKGTFRPDKYTLLLERNLWPQDAVSVMVGSGCLVHGRLISEHSSAQCLQSPCSSSCRAWGQSKQGWWRPPPGNLHPSGLLSLHCRHCLSLSSSANSSPTQETTPSSITYAQGAQKLQRVLVLVEVFFVCVLIYLVALGFSWGTRDLWSLLQHAGLLVMAWVSSPSHWSPKGCWSLGFRSGNLCTPVTDSCWCMVKPIQYCKVKKIKKIFFN